jgi:hypothetical protein
MKKTSWLLALIVLLLIVPAAFAEAPSTVLILISRENGRSPDLMLTKEVGVMASLLKEAGFAVKYSTPTEKDIAGSKTSLKSDLLNAAVDPANYVGFILPCMALPNQAIGVTPEFLQKVKDIGATGKPLAAQMSSIDILKKAGLLEGKKFSLSPSSGVVVDGNIVTNMACPYMAENALVDDLTAELTRRFIVLLKQ